MPNVKIGCRAFASNENERNGQHSVSNEITVAAKSRFSEERGTLNTYPSSVDFTSDALSLSTWRTSIFLSSSAFSSREHDDEDVLHRLYALCGSRMKAEPNKQSNVPNMSQIGFCSFNCSHPNQ